MKRYSKEEKAWLVQEWEKSGKSKWAFARELGLPYQTFRKWTSAREDGQDFVEVGAKVKEGGPARGERMGSALVVVAGKYPGTPAGRDKGGGSGGGSPGIEVRDDGRPQYGEDLYPARRDGFEERG